MTVAVVQVQGFMDYFTGNNLTYGEHVYVTHEEGKKEEGSSYTIKDTVLSIDNYKKHLNGERGLGLVPIMQDSKCKFGVIDVDIYNENLSVYLTAIERNNFPIVPFRSKSGGLHLYMFLKEPELAKDVVITLKQIAFYLSIDILVRRRENRMVEIFPKQTKLDPGQQGSWINLPYFGGENSKQCALHKGKDLTLSEALVLIKQKRVSLEEAQSFLGALEFSDAPPCLQLINILNPLGENSGRNNYLFSFGVYLKKKDEEFFEPVLMEINRNLPSPLGEKEVEQTIVSSLKRKDYVYKCSSSPCQDYCNKKVCQQREYGIGKNEGYFSTVECGQLWQYKIAQPYYEWEVKLQGQTDFKRLRFRSEDEIIKQDMFLRLCMRELYELPSKLKQSEWFKKVNQHLKEIKVIDTEEDEDTSPMVMLKYLIMDFLTGRAIAATKDQILAKRVYFNAETKEYWFRIQDMTDFVYVQKQFRYFSPQELHGILREMEVTHKRTHLGGSYVRVACLSQIKVEKYEQRSAYKPDFTELIKDDF